MHQMTPETTAYVAFWSVMNDQVNDLADEVQLFARQLQATEEKPRYERCTKYIRDSNTNGLPWLAAYLHAMPGFVGAIPERQQRIGLGRGILQSVSSARCMK